MAKVEQLVEHLPSLYRPEENDSGLISLFLQAAGHLMDDMSGDMGRIMQSHWFRYADSALYDDYATLNRQRQDLPLLDIKIPADRSELEDFPYLYDLARLGTLMSLPHWREPANLKEKVEEYRERLELYVKLYRNGFGTINALRTMIEGVLPPIPDVGRAQRERSFSIEEFTPIATTRAQFEARGAPFVSPGVSKHIVGPLMRWSFGNQGLKPAPATIYIEGVPAIPEEQEATINPVLELFAIGSQRPRLAIGYQGTVAAGTVLRLRPAYMSWLGQDDGLHHALSESNADHAANPGADGPWTPVVGSPTTPLTAMYQSHDRIMWFATDNSGVNELWRYNGNDWLRVLDTVTLDTIYCITEQGNDLLVGTATGLLRIPLYPSAEDPFEATPVASLTGMVVSDIMRDQDDRWWLATNDGVAWLNPDDSIELSPLQGTDIYALHQNKNGLIYAGGELGLFLYQSRTDDWYWYKGEEESDQEPDWVHFTAGELPDPEQVYLPPVNGIFCSRDTSVWVGTDQGFARYYARSVRGTTYKTLLEAFPDLVSGKVYNIKEDGNGLLWFCTERGLFRYDGRDIAQFISSSGRWKSHGRAIDIYEGDGDAQPRDAWRFNNTLAMPDWEYFDRGIGDWTVYTSDHRSDDENTVYNVIWTDSVTADIGVWDGSNFTSTSLVPHSDLVMRFKPHDERIVDGGLVAVPRMPVGDSTWRYLSLETPGMVISSNLPWWTKEGRSLPLDTTEPYPGRYGHTDLNPEHFYEETVFPYTPAAKVDFEWSGNQPFTVTVRLQKISNDESIHPAIIDRVWQGIQKVRPAGVKVSLAIENKFIKGDNP